MTVSEFFYMGGHAAYVWSAYGITAVVMTWVIVGPIIQRKKIIKELTRKINRQEANI